ncbi:hypothetical protein [Ferviditalea candida]|uniref:Uncharacterized protein n=1 Tax=Ferviditalea candida TaxID=3108399 RepID=A0ABU5ZFE5_9BACL|nr:hypothetical protein [Paenibacillaceae bacterium T2]
MPEKRRDGHELEDDVQKGLQTAMDDLQNTVKSLMELVPTNEEEKEKARELEELHKKYRSSHP